LDRIDLHVEVRRLELKDIKTEKKEEPSKDIRNRVIKSRQLQKKRFLDTGINCNAEMQSHHLPRYCPLDKKTQELLYQAFHKLNLSMRGLDRVVKIARTIADLDEAAKIEQIHLAEAIQYRCLDRSLW
jgi:magnesium chelatase family protein